MAQPYIGEIRMFAGNFPPNGWMFCDGQLLPISEYDVLFNLIGTTYGGDGQSTFALPDMRGRIPIHFGNGFILAQNGGVETVTLTVPQITAHTHPLIATNAIATQQNVSPNTFAEASLFNPYININPTAPMAPQAAGSTGGSQPHENRQPFLCVDFIISLFGIYPTPT